MFEILRKSLTTGIVTTDYPLGPAAVSSQNRGRPEIDFGKWRDARPAADICPTGAITVDDAQGIRQAGLDLGKCIFCGLCADIDPAIRMTQDCELAATRRASLHLQARYRLKLDGSHAQLLDTPFGAREIGRAHV